MRFLLIFASFLMASGCSSSANLNSLESQIGKITPSPGPSAPPVTSAYASSVLSDSPIGFWQLNETSGTTLADSSASGSGASMSGVVLLDQSSGQSGATSGGPNNYGALFDGSSAIIIPQESPVNAIANGIVSVEAWVNTTNTSYVPALVFSAWQGLNWNGYQIYMASGYAHLWAEGDLQSSAFISDGNWHQVVGVWDGTNASVYVDGALTGTQPMTIAGPASADAQIGTQCYGLGSTNCDYYFVGLIQAVSVYPIALTASQISAHFNAIGSQ